MAFVVPAQESVATELVLCQQHKLTLARLDIEDRQLHVSGLLDVEKLARFGTHYVDRQGPAVAGGTTGASLVER